MHAMRAGPLYLAREPRTFGLHFRIFHEAFAEFEADIGRIRSHLVRSATPGLAGRFARGADELARGVVAVFREAIVYFRAPSRSGRTARSPRSSSAYAGFGSLERRVGGRAKPRPVASLSRPRVAGVRTVDEVRRNALPASGRRSRACGMSTGSCAR